MGYITPIIRSETGSLEQKGWILLYGRRKTGKTYLLRNLYSPDVYILVKRDLSLWSEPEMDISSISRDVQSLLNKGKTVVIDEFQRMDEGVLEEITRAHPAGKLILSGSSFRVVEKLFSPSSPLLGFFRPLGLDIISPRDMVRSLRGKFNPDKVLELSTFLREPWLIPLFSGEEAGKFLYGIITDLNATITSLIGEIFTEEERERTRVYESLLGLMGSGVWSAKDLASILYTRKIISEPSSSHISQYLKNMRDMDLIESCRIFGSRREYHRLKSPIMNLYYYLDSRYNIAERRISREEVKPTLDRLIQMEIQNFLADIFAEIYDGRKEYLFSPEREIDFIITKRNKPVCVGEVKWGRVRNKHLKRFEDNTEKFSCDKVLIGKSADLKHPEIQIYSPGDILELVK